MGIAYIGVYGWENLRLDGQTFLSSLPDSKAAQASEFNDRLIYVRLLLLSIILPIDNKLVGRSYLFVLNFKTEILCFFKQQGKSFEGNKIKLIFDNLKAWVVPRVKSVLQKYKVQAGAINASMVNDLQRVMAFRLFVITPRCWISELLSRPVCLSWFHLLHYRKLTTCNRETD